MKTDLGEGYGGAELQLTNIAWPLQVVEFLMTEWKKNPSVSVNERLSLKVRQTT